MGYESPDTQYSDSFVSLSAVAAAVLSGWLSGDALYLRLFLAPSARFRFDTALLTAPAALRLSCVPSASEQQRFGHPVPSPCLGQPGHGSMATPETPPCLLSSLGLCRLWSHGSGSIWKFHPVHPGRGPFCPSDASAPSRSAPLPSSSLRAWSSHVVFLLSLQPSLSSLS